MSQHDAGKPDRAQTDESLRAEREKADAEVEKKRQASEGEEDEVLHLARTRADHVVEVARKIASAQRAGGGASGSDRVRADVVVTDERARADEALQLERDERRRYLADFLAAERDATDKDLFIERANADEVVAARDEFLATVSHDLRGLLSALGLNAELLVERAPDALGDAVRKHAAINKRLLGRMNTLINDLLDVASIEAGKLSCLPQHVEVHTLVDETIEAFQPVAASKKISLEAQAEPSPVLLYAMLDAGRILQVLANLVSNALKFTPVGGTVSIRVRAEGGNILFSVSDTGIGIPAEALPVVFDRFRQVVPTPGGLGLGLHISKSIVEAHGGKIWVESTLTAGSTFFFALPEAQGT